MSYEIQAKWQTDEGEEIISLDSFLSLADALHAHAALVLEVQKTTKANIRLEIKENTANGEESLQRNAIYN